MITKKLLNKISKAYHKREIKKVIYLSEKAGYFFLAGKIAKEQGWFNKSFELYKKGAKIEEYQYQQSCFENYCNFIKIISPKKNITFKKIQEREKIYGETNLTNSKNISYSFN